jgi:hypothetical protein
MIEREAFFHLIEGASFVLDAATLEHFVQRDTTPPPVIAVDESPMFGTGVARRGGHRHQALQSLFEGKWSILDRIEAQHFALQSLE